MHEDFPFFYEENELIPMSDNYDYDSNDIIIEEKCGYRLYYKLDRNYIIRKSYCEENFDFSLRRKS